MKRRLWIALPLLLVAGLALGAGISQWTAMVGAIADGDLLGITDVSDTSQSANGTSKKITMSQLSTYMETDFYTEGEVDTLLTALDAENVDIADAGEIITATDVEAALQEIKAAVDLNTAKETNTDDQTIDTLSLDGTTLSVSLEGDGEAPQTVDLAGLQDGTGTDDQNAGEVATNTTNFDNNLSAADTSVQAALETLDELAGGSVDDTAYGISWDGDTTTAPSKNAVYDKMETVGSASISDTAYSVVWNAQTTTGASRNAIYDYLVQFDADYDGDFTDEAWFPAGSGDDQTIDTLSLDGTTLSISLEGDGEAPQTVDLAGLQDGTGTDDQTAAEVEIADAGGIITATDVEGALQENRTAININTAKVSYTPATPGAIGGTTPAAGTFTTVTAASYASSAADGSRRSILPNNTAISPLGDGSEEIYNEGGEIKVVEGDTEYDIINSGDVDDTPVNGATAAPVSSNWAYDHGAAADPHTGYVLESVLGSGVGTFLATPSSANLAAAVTGETGSGALVFGTSPSLTTPALGTPTALVLTNATVASGTSLPGTCTVGQVFIDTDADTDGELYICRATNTWKAVDDDGGSGGLATTDIDTSAELRTIVGDEEGTGALLFAGGNIGAATATTPSANDNDTSVATTAYVQAELTAYASDTVTLTNKTLDTAGTGNSITVPYEVPITIITPADTDDPLVDKVKRAVTLTGIDCVALGGGTISVDLQECDANGANCATTGATIASCGATNTNDASLTNASIDSGDWMKLVIGAPSGTVNQVSVKIYGTQIW